MGSKFNRFDSGKSTLTSEYVSLRTNTMTFGPRSVSGPKIWNDLPARMKDEQNLAQKIASNNLI